MSKVFAVALLIVGAMGCEVARDSAGLAAELEERYPGSRIEIEDSHDMGTRTLKLTIRAASFGDVDLADEGREVAGLVQRRYELRGDGDTVSVEFQAEQEMGALATSSSATFVYPVSELEASD
jgi:Flp pilus assembly secretin CpaC